MNARWLSSARIGFLFALILVLGAAGLSAQPDSIPIAELTQEQFDNLPDEQLITMGETEATLGELRAREAARREAHETAAEANRQWVKEQLAVWEAARVEREARRSRAQDKMVMDMMAFTADLAAANPEMVTRAREQARLRREASELRRRALDATSKGELKRIEKELRRVGRQLSDGD